MLDLLAMVAARQGSLGGLRNAFCTRSCRTATLRQEAGDYSLASFRHDLSAFQTRYLDSH